MALTNKLTSIADEVRTLSGTEETLTLEEMKEKVGTANTDIAAEADLIVQIATALEGKSSGGNNNIIFPLSCDATWNNCSTLPQTFIPAPGAYSTYYLPWVDNAVILIFRDFSKISSDSLPPYIAFVRQVNGYAGPAGTATDALGIAFTPDFENKVIKIEILQDFSIGDLEYLWIYREVQ